MEETHTDENIEEAVPYEGAVEAVQRWHDGRPLDPRDQPPPRPPATPATRRWLEPTGIPYDDLHCSFDKITRCVELDIDLLVDDSPVNITRAREHGILAATLIHPWNEALVNQDGVIGGEGLARTGEGGQPSA